MKGRNMYRILLSVVIVFCIQIRARSQSCLPGWKYRMAIDMNNAGSSELTSIQLLLEFNSALYVSSGKMNISGADIRFTDNNNIALPHWIVPGTFNTPNTQIWVKVNAVPVGSSEIYMFYGNNNAYNTSNPQETFIFFDEFDAGTSHWNFCGGSHYTENGRLTLYSTVNNNKQAVMQTKASYPPPYISEMMVTEVTGDNARRVGLLQLNSATEGYGLTSIESGVNDKMEISRFSSGTNCFEAESSFGTPDLTSGIEGLWQFSWGAENYQQGIKGEGDINLQGNDNTHTYPVQMYAGVAVYGTTASITMEQFRIRKHAKPMPVLSLNTSSEAELPGSGTINMGANTPLCTGETLSLFADDIGDADYSWYKPDGTLLTNNVIPNPIHNASVADAGKYTLVVEPYSGTCSAITFETNVEIYPPAHQGTLEGAVTVCSGENSGTLELKNVAGEITHWEYSLTGGEPWAVISNTSSRQHYKNLTQTTHYRAKIKSGHCSTATTDIAVITVNSHTLAGTATGSTTICKNQSAEIQLKNYNADIISWQKSLDNANWGNTPFTNPTFNTGNLDTTTYYRAIVSNGVCSPDTSNTVKITINCPTVAGVVETDTVCKGSSGELKLTGNTGNVLYWQQSATGGKPWSIINETANKLVYENIQQTTYYRAAIQNPGCDTLYSTIGNLVVDIHPVANTIQGSSNACLTANTGEIILTDYTGKINNWAYSEDNGNSWNIMAHKGDTLNYNNLTSNTLYRAKINSPLGACPSAYSKQAQIDIIQPTIAGIIGNSAQVCAVQNEGVLKLTGHRGSISHWEKSATGKAPWQMLINTTDSLYYKDLDKSMYYRAVVKNDICPSKIADSALIQVTEPSNAGIITGSASHCAGSNQGVLTLANYNGVVTKWEKSTDKTNWQYQNNITPVTVEYNNLMDTTYYRVITQNGICPADTSAMAVVKTHPLPQTDFIADTAELGQATHFTNLSTIPAGIITEYYWDLGNGQGSSAKNPQETYAEATTYFVSLKAKSDKGCIDSIKKAILVLPVPQLDFTFQHVCLGDTVFFENKSSITSGSVSYTWDFGNGATSEQENPFYLFTTPGTYNITLKAVTDKGVETSISKQLDIYPRANILFNFAEKCEEQVVSFINQSSISSGGLNFYWDLGDGSTSVEINPNHAYANYGEYAVQLVAVTNHNCKDTLVRNIQIHEVPKADFTANDVPYKTPVQFTDNSQLLSTGINTWQWDFGDGNTSDIQNPEYIYAAPGNYLVNLTVKSTFGCTHTIAKNINIYPLPNADFMAENVCFGNPVSFVNKTNIQAGEITSHWDFGDGQSSVEQNPEHEYSQAGSYLVTLIATSGTQGKDTIQKEVSIHPNPVPGFNVPDVCDGYPSSFQNNSVIQTGNISSYSWDFGDGTNSIQENPVKQYLNAGKYTVQLKAKSENGCETTIQKEAYVRKNPLADFSFNHICVGKSIQLSNHTQNSEGDISYYWEMGDQNSYVTANPSHSYEIAGVYKIKLLARSSYQCVDSLTRYINVYPLPNVNAGVDTSVSKGFPINLEATGAGIYDWMPGESLSNSAISNPVARPMETTTYTVRGIDKNGCENTDEITITVLNDHLVIANNILTPDYNGLNDTWKIQNIDAFENATVYIFNRWGEEVYSQSNYMNNWDGRNNNGDVLPDGTYYYVIKFEGTTKHYSGSITILRNR